MISKSLDKFWIDAKLGRSGMIKNIFILKNSLLPLSSDVKTSLSKKTVLSRA